MTSPSKTIPRVLNGAMTIVLLLYVSANVAYVVTLPRSMFGDSDTIVLVRHTPTRTYQC